MQLGTHAVALARLQTFVGTVRITAVEAIPFAVPYRVRPSSPQGA